MVIKSSVFIKGITGTAAILQDGIPQVAFVGRSNVGKSSVINSLVNKKDLAKTGKKPGKTTEINFFLIDNKFYLVDLPGYGYAKLGPVQREKIQKLILWYLMYSEAMPAVIALVLDIKAGFTTFDKQLVEVVKEQQHPFMIIVNKSDKLNQKEAQAQLASIKEEAGTEAVMLYSALAKEGSSALLAQLLTYIA